jgi:hypothetical protein
VLALIGAASTADLDAALRTARYVLATIGDGGVA